MEQLMKTGPSARHHGTRTRTTARTLLVVAGLTLAGFIASGSGAVAGIAFAAVDTASDPIQITYRITSGNALGLTVVNNGFFGNNFRSRYPSFEYPLGSNIDHMPRGGIWVGAINAEGDTLVSTATVDGSTSSILPTAEFLPLAGTTMVERSMLPESRYYDRRARSEQDFLYSCADTAASLVIPGALDPHRPLHLQIDTETLLFGFDPYDAIVIANFKIINLGINPLFNVRIGLYTELASGYKDPGSVNWTSGWFKKKALEYADSSRLVMEHKYSSAAPGERATSWAGIKLLGSQPTPVGDCRVSFNWLNWDASRRWKDSERYLLLGNGEADTRVPVPGTDDPVEVLSVAGKEGAPSAFDVLESGDTLTVSFAFVGGMDDQLLTGRDARADLIYNAGWAQKAYDLISTHSPSPPEPFKLVSPANWDSLLTTQPTLSWRLPREMEAGDTIHYAVYWSEDSEFGSADSAAAGSDTTYTFDPSILRLHCTYYWKVRAWDTHGLTRWSRPAAGWSFYVRDAGTPIGLTIEAQSSESGILLTWSLPADVRALGFTVYRRVVGSEDWLPVSSLLPGDDATVTYVDDGAEPGVRYEYEVEVLGPSGPEGRWGPVSAELPAASLWLALSPNPGRQTLTVNFGMPQPGRAVLRLFNAAGREVAQEVLPSLRAGNHNIVWTPGEGRTRRQPSGAYWIRLETPAGSRTAPWTVLR